ncbi:MAG: hypothetical protein ABSB42_17155 [Tepidisphaeraceae bacterium]
MEKYTSPNEMRIAAHQPKPVEVVDLMVSGSGIPWEDRGSVGFMAAFFTTAWGMTFKPVRTLTKMRRPETADDAKRLAVAYGGIWFLAVGIQSAFAYFFFYVFYARDRMVDLDGQQYVINTILEALLAGAAAALLPTVVAWMFYRLTAFDMTAKAPPVLVYNCIVYLMGPSLLALIPGATVPWLALGPALAGAWMFVLLLIVAIERLRIRVAAAIIGSVITFLATAGMVIIGILLVQLLWCNLLDKASIVPSGQTTAQR